MTHSSRASTLLACLCLSSTPFALAQTAPSSRNVAQAKAPLLLADVRMPSKSDIKIKDLPKDIPPILKPKPAKTRVGERYRLWMSFNPTDVNDPMYPGKSQPYDDHRFECYGKLIVNGSTYWEMPKHDVMPVSQNVVHRNLPEPLKVNPRTQGYSLNSGPFGKGASFLFDAIDGNPSASTVRVSLKLYDRDNPAFFDEAPYPNGLDRNDDMFGDYNLSLNLLKMGEGHYYWFWNGKDESGNAVGSNLFLYIEHVETLYESTGSTLPKPQLPPQIPVPGPKGGPIFKRGPVLKSAPVLKNRE